jgi:hypothetical protein
MRARDFSVFQIVEVLLWPHVSCSLDNSCFSGAKRFGRETDNSRPASAEVKISGAGPLLLSYPSLHGQGELPILCLLMQLSTLPKCVMPNCCYVLGEGKFNLEHAMQAQSSSSCTALLFL